MLHRCSWPPRCCYFVALVRKYVFSSTSIVSNMWAAYNNARNLPGGQQRLTTNHVLHFTGSVTSATNATESPWQKFMVVLRERYGIVRPLLDRHLAQLKWGDFFKYISLCHFSSEVFEKYTASAPNEQCYNLQKFRIATTFLSVIWFLEVLRKKGAALQSSFQFTGPADKWTKWVHFHPMPCLPCVESPTLHDVR